MSFFRSLFRKTTNEPVVKEDNVGISHHEESYEWEPLPAFVPASPDDVKLVSILATAIATGDSPESHFIVKKVLQRNEEVKIISLITASIAAGQQDNSQLLIKKIYQKKN